MYRYIQTYRDMSTSKPSFCSARVRCCSIPSSHSHSDPSRNFLLSLSIYLWTVHFSRSAGWSVRVSFCCKYTKKKSCIRPTRSQRNAFLVSIIIFVARALSLAFLWARPGESEQLVAKDVGLKMYTTVWKSDLLFVGWIFIDLMSETK